MTEGQKKALLQLKRLSTIGDGNFELVGDPTVKDGVLIAKVALFIGAIETREGGLDLRDREEFVVQIPGGFPFDKPAVKVEHARFSGFPHVTWGKSICLYQSSIEWNPSDGMYGLFDRLNAWIGKAAINDMDPLEGPLEPPHHHTNFSHKPFVIRANAPSAAGDSWIGLACLDEHKNHIELVGWHELSSELPADKVLAFTAILPRPISMEFPTSGKDLFLEFEKAGMDKELLKRNLRLSAIFSPEDQPMFLIIGFPMRRSADGTSRIHFSAWRISEENANSLRCSVPLDGDTENLTNLRERLANSVVSIFELVGVDWCKVYEDRSEIVVRRDKGTEITWFSGKKVMILGCGAIGSWVAELITRAGSSEIILVDNGTVNPGVITRQNYCMDDIGAKKVNALKRRLGEISSVCEVTSVDIDANNLLIGIKDTLSDLDIVIDCTASHIVQMKLERDWSIFQTHTPLFLSFIIDADAKNCLGVIIPKNSPAGVWDAYMALKYQLCIDHTYDEITNSFYSDKYSKIMFQPEPGCSDPTFVGSMADVIGLVSNGLNIACSNLDAINVNTGFALSTDSHHVFSLGQFKDVNVGAYRVRIAKSIFKKAAEWIKKSNKCRFTDYETGGLLWGYWDEAVQVLWVFDLSGPPPDSKHTRAHFQCGVVGTADEHKLRMEKSYNACGFVGHWHTHPNMASFQSGEDINTMSMLVSRIGQNQKRSVMLILGRTKGVPTAGFYIYESQSIINSRELLSVGEAQFNI